MLLSSVTNKKIMSEIRSGDYQHPGEETAIDMVLSKIKNKGKESVILDVGCGLGGTADYIQKQGWGHVIGIDIDQDVIDIANSKYGTDKIIKNKSDIEKIFKENKSVFLNCDVMHAGDFFGENNLNIKFDIILLFNSFYLFKDHMIALKQLHKISKPSTTLALFDYLDHGEYKKYAYKEDNIAFLPHVLELKNLHKLLQATGWKEISLERIDDKYQIWYQKILNNLKSKKEYYDSKYGTKTMEIFTERYVHIYNAIKNNLLGGIILILKV